MSQIRAVKGGPAQVGVPEIGLPQIGAIAYIPKLFAALTAKLSGGLSPSEARTVIDLA